MSQDVSSKQLARAHLDELDEKIVQLLHQDGRMAYTEIAKRLDAAEATIRYRVQKLLDSGAIKIQAYLNPNRLGYRHVALISLSFSDLRQAKTVAEYLSQKDSVGYVAFTAGSSDLLVKVIFDTHEGLLDFLTDVRSHPSITGSDTQLVLKLFKSQYSFQLS